MTEPTPPADQPAPLIMSRLFDAPRERVFEAWSSADHVKRWFSPMPYTTPDAEVDFRAGGVFAVCMRSPDGHDFWNRGEFTEVSPPDRLAFAGSVTIGGKTAFAIHTTVTFEDRDGGTLMTVVQSYEIYDPAALASVKGAPEGWRTTLDKLEAEVARIVAGGA